MQRGGRRRRRGAGTDRRARGRAEVAPQGDYVDTGTRQRSPCALLSVRSRCFCAATDALPASKSSGARWRVATQAWPTCATRAAGCTCACPPAHPLEQDAAARTLQRHCTPHSASEALTHLLAGSWAFAARTTHLLRRVPCLRRHAGVHPGRAWARARAGRARGSQAVGPKSAHSSACERAGAPAGQGSPRRRCGPCCCPSQAARRGSPTGLASEQDLRVQMRSGRRCG